VVGVKQWREDYPGWEYSGAEIECIFETGESKVVSVIFVRELHDGLEEVPLFEFRDQDGGKIDWLTVDRWREKCP
jgi:hypothetical protein